MKISNKKPFVYSNKFELQMFELRTEFERSFAKQQKQQLLAKMFKRKAIRDVAYCYVKPDVLAKHILNKHYNSGL